MTDVARQTGARFPGSDVLLSTGRYRQPDLELRLAGADRHPDRRLRAAELRDRARDRGARSRQIPGVGDVGLHQVVERARAAIEVDRTRAQELGLDRARRAESVLVSLSGSGQVSPNYWVDPTIGIKYPVEIQTPQHQIDRSMRHQLVAAAATSRRIRSSCQCRLRSSAERRGEWSARQRAAGVRRLRERAGRRSGQRAATSTKVVSDAVAAETGAAATQSPCAARWKA